MDRARRDFLIRCCQSAGASLIPQRLRGLESLRGSPSRSDPSAGTDAQYHVHPHYRAQTPVDATLLKLPAGPDDFITEKYVEQIAAILSAWSSDLRQSPQNTQSIQKVLAQDFVASSWKPMESQVMRSGFIAASRNTFEQKLYLKQEEFLQEVRSATSAFSKIITADLQVTGIVVDLQSAAPHTTLHTRIFYEFVGTGRDFHREQRTGHWDLSWKMGGAGTLQLSRWQPLEETRSRTSRPVFGDVSGQAFSGVPSYSLQLKHGVDYWRTLLDGACGIDIYGHNGVSVADVDGDGHDDLYICQPAGLPNRLFRNRGDGTFEDITEASGLGILDNTACALFADIDNDGRQDAILVRASGPLLFLNQGGGRFRQKPDAFQFAKPPQGTFTGAALADYDRDGWLDIYFCLYIYYQGTDQYKYPLPYYAAENGPPNFLMRNNRDGTFRDVTVETGLDRNNTRYSFCCAWNDYNRDGWPDLYVVNDFGRKNLYRNNGDGTFTDVAREAGVEDVGAGMSVCWWNYDKHEADDLYVADMWTAAGERITAQDIFKKNTPSEIRALYRKHAMGNSLFHGDGDRFQDTTVSARVGMGRWSWSADAWDFDHDGFADLYVVNGMISGASPADLNSFFWRQVVANSPDNGQPAVAYEQGWTAINELIRADNTWSGFERNVFYANNRDGTFTDVSGVVGMDFIEDARSFGLADFDHDGRLEIALKNRSGPQLRIVKNIVDSLPPSISFRLRGTKSNRDAIGAVITVHTDKSSQMRSLQAGSGFLSQHSKELIFGLGEAKGSVRATIRWPSGLLQELENLSAGSRIFVEEGSAHYKLEPFHKYSPPQNPSVLGSQSVEQLPEISSTWLVEPVPAPQFSLPDLEDRPWALAAVRGNPVLLTFWSMRSADCVEALKTLNRSQPGRTLKSSLFVSLNVDDAGSLGDLRSFARDQDFRFPVLRGSEDIVAVYNIVYRYLFDRHRDLILPTSFLLDPKGEIVKVYRGSPDPAEVEEDNRRIPTTRGERLARALPFPGASDTLDFGRNSLSFGSIFFQRGYLDQAESWFQRAADQDSTNAEAWYGLGSVSLSQGKNTQARGHFERAIQSTAGYPGTLPNAWNNLGLLETREGHTDDAIRDFQKALGLNPQHLIALENLGSAYRQQKRWDDARAAFEKALAMDPNDAESNYGLGMVFAQTDDAEDAERYWLRALKSRPGYPEALNNLGVLYLRTRRRDQAVANFEECIRVAPAFDQSYLNLARVYLIEGKAEEARATLMQLLKQHPDHELGKKMLEDLPR